MVSATATKSVRGHEYVGLKVDVQRSQLEDATYMTEGGASQIFKAKYGGEVVVVKKPKLANAEDMDAYHEELKLLAGLKHPNLLPLLAARAWPPDYSFIFPYMENGSMEDLIHVQKWRPTWPAVLRHGVEIASGLAHLHSQGVVHRDLKPGNVLLGSAWQAQLSDFGLCARVKDLEDSLQASIYSTEDAEGKITAERWIKKSRGKPSGGFQKQHMVGTMIYMPPEVLQRKVHSLKADVYSFAITLCEIATGVIPYSDRSRNVALAHTVLDMSYNEQDLCAAICSENLRPALPEAAPDGLCELISECWHPDPNSRPSMTEVQRKLEALATTALGISVAEIEPLWRSPPEAPAEEVVGDVQPPDVNSIRWPAYESDTYIPSVSSGLFRTCGARGPDKMEDRHLMCFPLCETAPDVHLMGVFDGHRGQEASHLTSLVLRDLLLRNLSHASGRLENGGVLDDADVDEALIKSFLDADVLFKGQQERLYTTGGRRGEARKYPGCTAAAGLVCGNKLFVANAGDCRTMICSKGEGIPLSEDHTADLERERQRVVEAGGQVKLFNRSWRVEPAGLQVTRAIGDFDCKGTHGVVATPEICRRTLTPEDEFVVMACDGVWDVMSEQEVVEMIYTTVKEPSMCAKRLGVEAMNRGSGDNITVIVCFLRPVSTVERIY